MRTLRTSVVVAVLVAGVLAEQALACSCAGPGDPREELANADGAFYGELLERRATGPGLSSGEPVILRYRVIRVFKGDIGAEVEVETAASGASCGIEAEIGDQDGLLLERDAQGRWSGNLCQMRSEAHLAAGTEQMPAPDGEPPARFLVGGGFGGPRTAALDARGRVVGYGDGPGDVRALDLCGGATSAVELVTGLDGRAGVAVRDVATLA